MVITGALFGLVFGIASARFVETLLYQVRPTDVLMLATPTVVILLAAALSAFPAVLRALRVDPVATLRAE
jgi:putative ABC transport system permease protein